MTTKILIKLFFSVLQEQNVTGVFMYAGELAMPTIVVFGVALILVFIKQTETKSQVANSMINLKRNWQTSFRFPSKTIKLTQFL